MAKYSEILKHDQDIDSLKADMRSAGEIPFTKEAGRTDMGQVFYFLTGASAKDGLHDKSSHQFNMATDIYFMKPDMSGYDWSEELCERWHKVWVEKYNGKPMIVFKDGKKDLPHYESKTEVK